MKKSAKISLVIILALLALIFVISTYRVTSTIHEYNESDRYYQQARETVVKENTSQTPSDEPAAVQKDPRTYSPVTVDFSALQKDYPDIRGWLYAPGTEINYPVVQGKDNDFYLHRLMDGADNAGGTLFMDYRNSADFSSKHTLIYGHHMKDGSMFAALVNYADQAYYDEHPYLFLNTPNGNYRLDAVAGFVTLDDSRAYVMDFKSRAEFEEWYELMSSFSDFTSDVSFGPDDLIVTLSTCTYDYDNARYVLMTKLVPLDD